VVERRIDPVAVLRRWEDAGGMWRVLERQHGSVIVGLFRCDGGEEVDRLVTGDAQVRQFLAGRVRSDDPVAERDRDSAGRARQARPRDRLGRPLLYGSLGGVDPVSDDPLPPEETIRSAGELLDQGRPFSAHEVYEARWKSAPDIELDLWQGLAQLCVGITHRERGNRVGAVRLITRARTRLEAYEVTGGPLYGLDMNRILAWIAKPHNYADEGSWLADHLL
jgi:uncharacterized protein